MESLNIINQYMNESLLHSVFHVGMYVYQKYRSLQPTEVEILQQPSYH